MTHNNNTGHQSYLEACLSQTIRNSRRYAIGDCLDHPELMNVDFDKILSGLNHSIKLNSAPSPSTKGTKQGSADFYLCIFPISRNFAADAGSGAGLTCPLLWIDLKLVPDRCAEWTVDRSRLRLNIRLLSDLSGLPPMHPRLNRLSKQLHEGCLKKKDRIWLKRQLEALAPNTNWQALTEPLKYANSISVHMGTNDNEARCHASVFVKTQQLSLREESMVSELKQCLDNLEESDTVSSLLSAKNAEPVRSSLNIQSPTSLTDEQSEVFAALNHKNFVTVAGGTGTGKSLILAACATGAAAAGKKTLVVAASTSGRDRLSEQIHTLSRGAIPSLRSCGGGELGLLNKLMNETIAGFEEDTATTSLPDDWNETKGEDGTKMWQAALAEACGQSKSIGATLRSLLTNLSGPQKESLQSLFTSESIDEANLADERNASLRRLYNERCQIEICAHNDSLKQFLSAETVEDLPHSGLNIPFDLWSCYLSVCPIWIVDLESLNRLLPFRKDLFDMVVIDEATHMDITRPVPALYRAKAACIAADPSDSGRHTDLSQADESLFAESNARLPPTVLSFRDCSLWDMAILANNGLPDVTLSESYRCIEAFCTTPIKDKINDESLSIELVSRAANQITWHFHQQVSSNEDTTVDEASRLLEAVKALHGKTRTHASPPTIGILAPIKSQVRHLKSLAQDVLPLFAYEQHKLLIGSPSAFRGLEKDLLFCSIGVTEDASVQSVRQLDQFNLWNSVLSRAKSNVHLFTSLKPSSLPPKHLLHRLAHPAHQGARSSIVPDGLLSQRLRDKGFSTSSTQRFHGLNVDFIIERERLKCGAYWLDRNRARPLAQLSRNLAHARHCALPIFIFEAEEIHADTESALTAFERWFLQHALLAWW